MIKKLAIKKTLVVLTLLNVSLVNAQQVNGGGTPSNAQHTTSSNFSATSTKRLSAGNGLGFQENKGQIADTDGKLCPDVLYKGEAAGADVYLRKTGISYVYSNMGEVAHKVKEQVEDLLKAGIIKRTEEHIKQDELMQKEQLSVHRVDMDFAAANKNCQRINESPLEGFQNYYYSHCPQGITNVHQYNKVTYKDIYKGVDISYHGDKQNGLKYDLIVQPHADPNQIKLHWKGAEELKITNGELKIKNSFGEMIETIPKVYQNINGEIVDVKCKYKLDVRHQNTDQPVQQAGMRNDSKKNTSHVSHLKFPIYEVSFELGTYNLELPLIIDPWVSYYGGNTYDGGTGVATDPSGNVIFCGHTTSTNFPVTAGAFQTVFNGPTSFLNTKGDVFVVKMSAAGLRLWATYYGGTDNETAQSVTTDGVGNIYVTGVTLSTNFPTGATAGNNIHQGTYGGGGTSIDNWFKGDAFVIAFNSTGARKWATYYGGSSDDTGSGITTDGTNVYLSGSTYSGNAITNGAPFQSLINGTGVVSTTFCDAFVVKFLPNGSTVWGTYIGGSNREKGSGIACDLAGNIYVAGGTVSANFPVSPTGYQLANGGGNGDAFIFKFTPAGARIWATYYGGSYQTMYDLPIPVTTDNINNVIIGCTIAGNVNTSTNDGSSSPGAYQQLYGGGLFEGLIVKFNSTGARQWGTYLGGNSDEYIFSLATDAANNIYAYGEWEDTGPKNYPISSCAYQPIFGGGFEDQYIAKYDPNGQQRCITYMGGSKEDDLDNGGPQLIAVFGNVLYITGYNIGGGYPVTPGAYQTNYGAAQDGSTSAAFIAQLCINICEGKTLVINPTVNSSTCPNAPITFSPNVINSCDTSNYKYQWTFTGGTPSTSNATNPSISYSSPGNYAVKLVVTTPCKKDSITKANYVIVNPCTINATATGAVLCSSNSCANISATGSGGSSPYTYSWNTGATNSTINVCPPIGTTTYTVKVTDATGNYAFTTTSVTINQSPVLKTSSSNVTCTANGRASVDSVNGLSSSQGMAGQILWNYQFNWSNNNHSYTTGYAGAGAYTVTVTDINNGCTATQTYSLTSTSPISATYSYTPVVCIGSSSTFTNTGSTGAGITHEWFIFPLSPNVSGTSTDFSYTFLTAGTYTVRHTVKNGTCTNEVNGEITIINCNGPTATVVGSSTCSGTCTTVTSSAAGGTQPYTYSWNTGETTQNISPCLTSTTTYTVKITDAGGATATSTATVTVYPTVTASSTVGIINCSGGTGSATATGSGGTSPYTFNWSTGVTTTGASSTIPNLPANTYSVIITDSKGCTATSTTILVAPTPLLGQFSKGTAACTNCGCKEWVLVNATGGTMPYSYLWVDGYDKRYKNKLCPGSFSINIKDKNGCSVDISGTAP